MRQRTAREGSKSRDDAARFLGITGRGGRAITALFLLTQLALAATSNLALALTPPDATALVVLILITVLVMGPGSYPLSHRRSFMIVFGVGAITVLVNSVLPVSGWPGYESWQFGANTLVLLALGLRGQNLWAWGGMLLMTALTIVWTVGSGQGVMNGIGLIDRNAGTLLIGTVFSVGIRRSIRWIAALNRTEQRQVTEEAFAHAKLEQRRVAAEALEKSAVPALNAIADNDSLSLAERRSFLVVEAGLRDAVRAPAINREPLVSAVERARIGGKEVVLLEDGGSSLFVAEKVFGTMLERAGARIDATQAKRITVRLANDAENVVMTVVEDSGRPFIIRVDPAYSP